MWQSDPAPACRDLRQHLLDDLAVHVRQPFVAAVVPVRQPQVIQPHQVQDRRVQVGDVAGIFDGAEAELIRCADRLAATDASSRQPHRKPVPVVVPPLTNEYIGLFKASALLYFISVFEITFLSKQEAYQGHPFESFAMITGIFLLITVTIARVVQYFEARYRIPGLGIEPARD